MDIFVKENDYSTGTISIFLALYIVMTIIYSLEDVLNKICLNQLLIRPYELMFYKAVFQIFVIIPLTIFMLVFYSNEFDIHMNSINFFGRLATFLFLLIIKINI